MVNTDPMVHLDMQTDSVPTTLPFAKPKVSVVVPVYNAGNHLVRALGSIIEQSFTEWEMICVNDGSRDGSGNVLDWFARQDSRIRVIHQDNTGIVGALNRGCEAARSDYICRMDADDIALPDRIATQYDFMQTHPDCVAVGGAIVEMDVDSSPLATSRLPGEHDQIVDRLLHRQTGLFHPTTMIRRSAFENVGGYRKEYEWIEDHDLWLRLSMIGKLYNASQVVLCYRQHATSVCWQKSQRQRELMSQLLQSAYQQRGLILPPALAGSDRPNRSKANPGKWARAAVRGGYPGTAVKHLLGMWKEQGITPYSLRMSAEVLSRLPVSIAKRMLNGNHAEIPSVEIWEQRWKRSA